MKAAELIEALSKKLETNSQAELASILGVTVAYDIALNVFVGAGY